MSLESRTTNIPQPDPSEWQQADEFPDVSWAYTDDLLGSEIDGPECFAHAYNEMQENSFKRPLSLRPDPFKEEANG